MKENWKVNDPIIVFSSIIRQLINFWKNKKETRNNEIIIFMKWNLSL